MTGSKHGASAIATLREAGIHIVVLFHTLVVGGGSLLTKRPGDSEGAVIDDVLVVIFDDNCSSSSSFMSASLTFLGVFFLTKGADVEIIVDNSLNRYDTPFRFCFDSVFFTGLVLPLLEGAARSVTVFLEGQLGTGKSLPCLFFTFIYAIALKKSEGQFSNDNTG